MSLIQDVYKKGMTQDEFLRELFYEVSVRTGMFRNKGATREEIISGQRGKQKDLLEDIKSGKTLDVGTLLNSLYNLRRAADIKDGDTVENRKNFKSALNARSPFVGKKPENGWNFRTPLGVNTNAPTVERLIVNARPDAEIIKKLDDFCHKNKCYYKVPDPDRFSERVDTVVVYAKEKLSDKVKAEFAKMMSPYVRKERTNDLDGEKLADGIFWAEENSSAADIDAVLARFDTQMYPAIKGFLQTPSGKLKISLGQRKVLEEFAAALEQVKQNQQEDKPMEDKNYKEFLDSYQKANGDLSKIEMSKLPVEIQQMFSDNNYGEQIKLFDYCQDNLPKGKLKGEAKKLMSNLKTLQRLLTPKQSLKKQIERDKEWYDKDPDAREGWRKGLSSFLKEKRKDIQDAALLTRLDTYLEFLDNPKDFDVEKIKEKSDSGKPVTFSNEDDGQEDNPDQNLNTDYLEPIDKKHPKLLNCVKQAFEEAGIAVRAVKEGQNDYPFTYNLYEKGKKPEDDDVKPTGKLEVVKEDHVVLHSKDIRHFVASMKGIKAAGKEEINLDLNKGTEADKKAFAANAVLAGIITGIKVNGCPYSLEQLKEVNPLIEKAIELREKQTKISELSGEVETNGDAAKEQALEQHIGEAIKTYQQISKDLLPPKDQIRVFECGARAVEKQKTRNIALKVIQNLNRGSSGNG